VKSALVCVQVAVLLGWAYPVHRNLRALLIVGRHLAIRILVQLRTVVNSNVLVDCRDDDEEQRN
jgi:hypothetical protein